MYADHISYHRGRESFNREFQVGSECCTKLMLFRLENISTLSTLKHAWVYAHNVWNLVLLGGGIVDSFIYTTLWHPPFTFPSLWLINYVKWSGKVLHISKRKLVYNRLLMRYEECLWTVLNQKNTYPFCFSGCRVHECYSSLEPNI